jgi:hypothetical protein
VTVGRPDSLLGQARLGRFATRQDATWRVTADSIRAARERGLTADQVLSWLRLHASSELPALLQTAIRHWAGAQRKVFLGELLVLQIDDPAVYEAVRQSDRARPFLEGTLVPGCLVIRLDQRKALGRLLGELGFDLGKTCSLDEGQPSPSSSSGSRAKPAALRPRRR